MNRCEWPKANESMIHYHDTEWGVPVHNDVKLFEFMVLDAFQAGLSWQIVLKKREAFRQAMDNFDPHRIANYGKETLAQLLSNPEIIRNRLKLEAAISNANAFIRLQDKSGSFDRYIWQFTDYTTQQNQWQHMGEIPSRSPSSDAMSKSLIENGFKFVGSTICYAFMQAAGMVNDHVISCFRYDQIRALAQA